MIFEKVQNIIVEQMDIDPEKVTLDSFFIEDLDADSLSIMEMIVAFENEFDIEITETSLEDIKQVKDVVEYFENNIQ